MSRRVLPACSSLCYFCPSLRARSRQPVKRYKKIISEIYQLPPVWPILLFFFYSATGCVVKTVREFDGN